jgi:RNase H-like domain found in reverse transcriptase
MMPDHSKPFQIESDTSKYASGAVLTQTDINGDRHPVAFLSKTFTDTEQQYKIYDRELLGIVQALKEWRHYIQGSGHTTLIHMDHQNLTYFQKAQKLFDRQARWSLFLSEFDIKLQHLPGNKMILSDALSRRPDHCPEEDETKEEILLPDDLFLNLLDINLGDRITRNKDYDFNVTRAIELLQEEGPTIIQNDLED